MELKHGKSPFANEVYPLPRWEGQNIVHSNPLLLIFWQPAEFLLRLAVSCVWSNNDSSVMRQTVQWGTGMVRHCGIRPTGLRLKTCKFGRDVNRSGFNLQSKCESVRIIWVQNKVMLCVCQYAVICRESLYKILTCVIPQLLSDRHIMCNVRFVYVIILNGPLSFIHTNSCTFSYNYVSLF